MTDLAFEGPQGTWVKTGESVMAYKVKECPLEAKTLPFKPPHACQALLNTPPYSQDVPPPHSHGLCLRRLSGRSNPQRPVRHLHRLRHPLHRQQQPLGQLVRQLRRKPGHHRQLGLQLRRLLEYQVELARRQQPGQVLRQQPGFLHQEAC